MHFMLEPLAPIQQNGLVVRPALGPRGEEDEERSIQRVALHAFHSVLVVPGHGNGLGRSM